MTIAENLEIPFLLWLTFSNVFPHEKRGYNYVSDKISQKRNINRKKSHIVFCETSDFQLATNSLKSA